MPIQVTCPSCQTTLKTADASAGKRAKCPKCGGIIQIPAATAPPENTFEAAANPLAGFTEEELTGGPAVPTTNDRAPCPACGELIARDAVKCRFCGEVLNAALKGKSPTAGRATKTAAATDGSDELSVLEWILAILCSTIGCIVGIIWMIQGKPKGKKLLIVSLVVMAIGFILNVMIALTQGVN